MMITATRAKIIIKETFAGRTMRNVWVPVIQQTKIQHSTYDSYPR